MAAATSTEAPVGAMNKRVTIVAEARSWIGTPYRHQASAKGAGCDCFGLVRGVWRSVIGPEPEDVPAYSRDWGSVQGTETLLATARRHLVPVDVAAIAPGDIVVFRIRRGIVAKHVGIVTEVASVASSFPAPAARAPSPTLPHKGGGSRVSTPPLSGCIRGEVGANAPLSPLVGERWRGGNAGRGVVPRGAPNTGGRPARFVHAQENVPVAEVALSEWWRQRIVAAFAFPGV